MTGEDLMSINSEFSDPSAIAVEEKDEAMNEREENEDECSLSFSVALFIAYFV